MSEKYQDIRQRRMALAKKRRLKLYRLLVVLVLFAALLGALGYGAYKLYTWIEPIYQDVNQRYEDYSQRQEERRQAVDHSYDGYMNVMLLGIDNGVNELDAPIRQSDAVFLFSIERDTGKLRCLAIPRDTMLNIPGNPAPVTMSMAYSMGGASTVTEAVTQLTGVPVHQYMTIDMAAMQDIIDAIGGMDIYVEKNMYYEDQEAGIDINLFQGYQHLNGAEAVSYVRYKDPGLGDIGRILRQEYFIKGLYGQLMTSNVIKGLPEIKSIMEHKATTSAEIFDALHIVAVVKGIVFDKPETFMLPGKYSQDGTAWEPDQDQLQDKLQEMFPLRTQ